MLREPSQFRVLSSPYPPRGLTASRAADSVNYPTAGNSGPPGQGLNHAAPPSAGRAHLSQCDEHTIELRFEPSPTGHPKPRSSHQWPVGPTHACQTAPSEHVGSPRPVIQATPR
ncbi:hypothetical protein G5714_024594 [Onychostoma macrolepis]|uniref:Uncharacterized protein n=1 Tax=Onychostoma macrolepis TaxID=369639 RepID=A0A7J6BHQ3_9TELE|nr:hypothetical protein G5714_024594 [Onychostoma macrolepis]